MYYKAFMKTVDGKPFSWELYKCPTYHYGDKIGDDTTRENEVKKWKTTTSGLDYMMTVVSADNEIEAFIKVIGLLDGYIEGKR